MASLSPGHGGPEGPFWNIKLPAHNLSGAPLWSAALSPPCKMPQGDLHHLSCRPLQPLPTAPHGQGGLLSRMETFSPVGSVSLSFELYLKRHLLREAFPNLTLLLPPLATPSSPASPRAHQGGSSICLHAETQHASPALQVAQHTAGTYKLSGNEMNQARRFPPGNIGTRPGATAAASPGRMERSKR